VQLILLHRSDLVCRIDKKKSVASVADSQTPIIPQEVTRFLCDHQGLHQSNTLATPLIKKMYTALYLQLIEIKITSHKNDQVLM